MARYKMTVVFDVHDDEDRRELMRQQQEKKHNPEKFKGRNLRVFIGGTPSERRRGALETDPLTDESYFLRSVMDRLHEMRAFPYDQVQMPMYRTTYEIISCKRLKE
jgi:hypothetical protein